MDNTEGQDSRATLFHNLGSSHDNHSGDDNHPLGNSEIHYMGDRTLAESDAEGMFLDRDMSCGLPSRVQHIMAEAVDTLIVRKGDFAESCMADYTQPPEN